MNPLPLTSLFLSGLLAGLLIGQSKGVRKLVQRGKGLFKGLLIRSALLNPGASNRHGWVGDAKYAAMKREFQISFLKTFGLKSGHRLMDYGCGSLRGGIPIIQYLERGHYYGVEVRPQVLQEAQKELAEQGLENKEPVLMLFREAPEKLQNMTFDCIWAFNVLIHLHDDVLSESLRLIAAHLSDGIFYASVSLGPAEDAEWQGFPFVTRPLLFYEDRAVEHGLQLKVLGTLDHLGYGAQYGKRSDLVMLEFCRTKVAD
jgi:SAM-dependent methyltransferase